MKRNVIIFLQNPHKNKNWTKKERQMQGPESSILLRITQTQVEMYFWRQKRKVLAS